MNNKLESDEVNSLLKLFNDDIHVLGAYENFYLVRDVQDFIDTLKMID